MEGLLTLEFAGSLLGALLTVMILSYLLGDNPFFQLATHVFVGVAAGYAGAVAWHAILRPALVEPILTRRVLSLLFGPASDVGGALGLLAPWLLVLLLLLKASPSTARWGSLPLALMVGVGAGVAVGGAITGTLIPQTLAAIGSLNPAASPLRPGETPIERVLTALLLLLAAVSTLLYFQFSVRRTPLGDGNRPLPSALLNGVGRVFIAITFGAMYAGALMASVAVLSERIQSLWDLIAQLLITL